MTARSARPSNTQAQRVSTDSTPAEKPGTQGPEAELAAVFRQHGYFRVPDNRRRREGYETYKKGWEVRLVLADRRSLAAVRKLLRRAHLPVARSFRKGQKWVQPVYGREAVEAFQSWIEAD